MNRENIIRMAREVGIDPESDTLCNYDGWVDTLVDFAALVVAAEREKLAAWMTRQGYATGHGDTVEDLLKELEWQIEDRIKNIIRTKTTYVMQNDLAESVEPDEESDK